MNNNSKTNKKQLLEYPNIDPNTRNRKAIMAGRQFNNVLPTPPTPMVIN